MLSDFLRTLVDFIQFLWPLKIAAEWERALILVFGHVMWEVGPGMYPVIPWFMSFHETSIAWDPFTTENCDITTKDNRTLTFSATYSIRVVNIRKALVEVHDYDTMARETVQGVMSEELASVDPERFEPSKRNALNRYLKIQVEKELEAVGLELQWVRFSTFVLNPKMIRLLGGSTLV